MRPFRLIRPGRRRGAKEGSAATEFAIVALPFCFMMFAVLELGMVFVIDSVLENATIETGRLVRTGQAESQNFNAATFKTRLCAQMSIFQADCATRAFVDVRQLTQFSSTVPDPMSTGTFKSSDLTYNQGTAGSIIVVRVWYKQPLLTPFLSQGLSRLNDGSAMLMAVTTFRNEPWNTSRSTTP
jgi:Flp pilus assembly protein TadG